MTQEYIEQHHFPVLDMDFKTGAELIPLDDLSVYSLDYAQEHYLGHRLVGLKGYVFKVVEIKRTRKIWLPIPNLKMGELVVEHVGELTVEQIKDHFLEMKRPDGSYAVEDEELREWFKSAKDIKGLFG